LGQLSLVPQWRELGWETVRCHLVQAHGPVEVLEPLLAEVAEEDVQVLLLVLEQRLRRLRDEHLTTVASGADAGGAVDRQAGIAAVRYNRLAGVDPHPHLHLHPVRPAMRQDRKLPLDRSLHRVTRAREGNEERVALRVDLVTVVVAESLAK